MTNPLTRAQQLIAKANDPATSQEEARTCAQVAVKLIGKHKMRLVMGDGQRPGPAPGRRSGPSGPAGNPFSGVEGFSDLWEEIIRQAREATAQGTYSSGPPCEGCGDPIPEHPINPNYERVTTKNGKHYHRVCVKEKAKAAPSQVNTCPHCQKAVMSDQPRVQPEFRGPWMHTDCHDKAEAKKKARKRCCICGEGPRTDAPFIDTGEVVDGQMFIVHGGLCQMRWGERVRARNEATRPPSSSTAYEYASVNFNGHEWPRSGFPFRIKITDDPKVQAQEKFREGWDRTFGGDDKEPK